VRLLHVGSGFRPWRRGGLVAYVEDLMDEQARRGHAVDYLFAGRRYPYVTGPRLRRWRRGEVAMLEVVNSPLYDHGRQPAAELDEPRLERGFERVLRERRPDVVHVHEVAGLPSSVLEVARRLGVPTVVTLQDYFFLCPTFRLLDAGGRVFLCRDVGVECVIATTADRRPPWLMVEATLRHDLPRLPVVRRLPAHRRDPVVARVSAGLARRTAAPVPEGAAAFQRRRDVNVERLGRATRVIAMSQRVAEIHVDLGVDPARMQTLPLTLAHLDGLRPREASPGGPVTFGTLGALESEAKGARLLLAAVAELEATLPPRSFRVVVLGHVDPAFVAEADGLAAVELRGTYPPDRLDALLDEVDVGLMPSIWEEAYGYAGLEFLAKGIPVVANAIGGMPDYTRPGETGWLNRSCSAGELAEIMADVVRRPEQVAELNARLRARVRRSSSRCPPTPPRWTPCTATCSLSGSARAAGAARGRRRAPGPLGLRTQPRAERPRPPRTSAAYAARRVAAPARLSAPITAARRRPRRRTIHAYEQRCQCTRRCAPQRWPAAADSTWSTTRVGS
jgi:glycosyltransferase involved in cell wall biosynthesis